MEISPADSPARLSEFEFWAAGNNPSAPQTHILAAADELFSGGIILPLHLLSISNSGDSASSPAPAASITSTAAAAAGASKRWKNIFKTGEKKFAGDDDEKGKNKRKKERKRKRMMITGAGGGAAELNINIWPFTRSRSAGNGGGSARPPAPARKASSAPCSRSNSRSELVSPVSTKNTEDRNRCVDASSVFGGQSRQCVDASSAAASTPRRCTASPGRNGVHVGRSSHVCRKMKNAAAAGRKSIGAGGNVAGKKKAAAAMATASGDGGITCIGYRARRPASCRVEGKLRGGGDHGGGRLINLRAIFKNVH